MSKYLSNPKRKQRLQQEAKMRHKIKNIAHELRTQPNDGTANPVFWTIQQTETRITENGYHDFIEYGYYDGGDYTEFRSIQDVIDFIIDYELEKDITCSLSDIKQCDSLDEAFDLHLDIEENFVMHYMEKVSINRENRMFLLKSEAQQELKNRPYDYKKSAHTYGMMAQYAPKTETILKYIAQQKPHKKRRRS